MSIVKKATPAAIAVLRQATALRPLRNKASDGLLPSAAHQVQNPSSDHNSGYAVDLTNDPKNGISCAEIFENLKADKRVKYLIFNGFIWSKDKAASGNRKYTGTNQHHKHLHISINEDCGANVTPWFTWLGKPNPIGKVIAAVTPLSKKKETK